MCAVSEIHGITVTEKTRVLTQYKIFHHDICMETEKYRQLLEEIFNIHNVPHTDEAVTNLLGMFKPETYKQGSSFIREGDNSTRIGIVAKGLFRSFYIDADGNDFTKYFIPEKDMLISLDAYLTKTPSRYFVEALENSIVLTAEISDAELLYKTDSAVQAVFDHILRAIMVRKERYAVRLKMEDAAGRYLSFHNEQPELENRIKQSDLATFLGMTPVSLSRVRKRLGLIK